MPEGIETIVVKGITALVRDGTSDSFIVDEVINGNEYRKLSVQPDDVVVDCGLNIGMFTIWAIKKGAKHVHAFEPEPGNFAMAEANVAANCDAGRYTLNEMAVTGTEEPTRLFSINQKKNKGLHSLIAKRGRYTIRVECESLSSILRRIRPTILKMDTEGGEYECIKNCESFAGVREFIFEFHHAHLDDVESRVKYTEVIEILERHFETVNYRKETKKAWVTIVHCTNPPA